MAMNNKKLFLYILLAGLAVVFVLGFTNRSFSNWILMAGKGGPGPIDPNPPTVTITSPTDGSMVAKGSTVAISAEAYDDGGIAKVSFYVDGKRKCVSTTPSYICSWKVPGAAGKIYQLQAIATDTAGNVGPSPLVNVTAQ